jgi:hypothetical protein
MVSQARLWWILLLPRGGGSEQDENEHGAAQNFRKLPQPLEKCHPWLSKDQ